MNVGDALCRVFCDGITVSEIPAGLAVSTGFEDFSGDRIGFYLTIDDETGLYRLEDAGDLVPTLIASGIDVFRGARARLFETLLSQGQIEYDQENGELRSPLLPEEEVPAAAMRFVAVLMRVAGLSVARPEFVRASFRDDAIARIKADLSERFEIIEGEPSNDELAEYEPDLLLKAAEKRPVAVFIATSDNRIYEAMLMHQMVEYKLHIPFSVVALIDQEGSKLTTKKLRQRARNHLPAAPEFYGDEGAAVLRIASEAERWYAH